MNERRLLVVRFAAIVALAGYLAWMLARAYQPGSAAYDLLHAVGRSLDVGRGDYMELFAMAALGGYFGLLGLFALDNRKRVQGALLLVGTLIGLVVLAEFGLLLAHVDLLDPLNWAAGVAGVALAFLVEWPTLRRVAVGAPPHDEGFDSDRIEFPRSTVGVFVLFAGLVGGGCLQALLVGRSVPPVDALATAAFVYLLFGFVTYDARSVGQVVGGMGVGKTAALLRQFDYFNRRDNVDTRPSEDLKEPLGQEDRMTQGDDFPVSNTKELKRYAFSTVSGELFPERLTVEVLDHPGEQLWRTIAPALREPLSVPGLARGAVIELLGWQRCLGLPDGLGIDEDFLLSYRIRTADALVLTVDGAQLAVGGPMRLGELQTVASRVRDNGGAVTVMVTKCDVLLDEYPGGSRIRPDGGAGLLYAEDTTDVAVESLQEYATELLRQRAQGEALLDAADVEYVMPVYYRTRERADGELVPDLEDGRPIGVGFDRVAEWLERNLR